MLSDSANSVVQSSMPMSNLSSGRTIGSAMECEALYYFEEANIRTVKVSNISLAASERDIKEFFSFSGDLQYVEMQRETEQTQVAYVTFKESQGADTAMLLSGATIADLSVTITPVENYLLPPEALPQEERKPLATSATVQKAEDVVSTMLAKGFVLGKDALNKAKAFDERHHWTSTASATVASIDNRMGFTEKLSIGTAVVNEKVREMDERFQVSEMTKSAFAIAEQKAISAGSAIMGNRYVSTGASWVSNAFSAVAKAAEDVTLMTKEKVEKAEDEKKEIIYRERTGFVDDFAHTHLDESSAWEPPTVSVNSSHDDTKLGII
ncbi:binding partner of ACD11 1-like isoform X2 [Malania oleifera]|uniref:binding partner of ACD11 1-like isoform X2 n=1 Tax=Malania oleifera TaxID=397392 RepID=UPI0025ADD219|nr:binding partner of ACD11 1-like isoform X2 [Malania oleifera]